MKTAEELSDICEDVSVEKMRIPELDVYRCNKKEDCESKMPYCGVDLCKKVYDIQDMEYDAE